MSAFIQTDDYQFLSDEGDRTYILIEGYPDWDDDYEEDYFDIFSGFISLDDYSDEEIEDCVKTYYSSYEEFEQSCTSDKERNQLLAEMLFESDLQDCSYLGRFKEKEALNFMDKWMSDGERPEPEEDLDR